MENSVNALSIIYVLALFGWVVLGSPLSTDTINDQTYTSVWPEKMLIAGLAERRPQNRDSVYLGGSAVN